jgi:hypothetical protein
LALFERGRERTHGEDVRERIWMRITILAGTKLAMVAVMPVMIAGLELSIPSRLFVGRRL